MGAIGLNSWIFLIILRHAQMNVSIQAIEVLYTGTAYRGENCEIELEA